MYNKDFICRFLKEKFPNEQFTIIEDSLNEEQNNNLQLNQLFFHLENATLTIQYETPKAVFGYLVTFHRSDFNPSEKINLSIPIS